MDKMHRHFLVDLLSKIGVPVFAATIVGCILSEKMEISHAILILVGLILTYLGHRLEHHTHSTAAPSAEQ